MKNIWFVSDTHFQHGNILTFIDYSGQPTRPMWFVDDRENKLLMEEKTREMDEYMIDQWNARVQDGDSVYHLGDVAFGQRDKIPQIMARLKGKKRLTPGNNDDIKRIVQYFEKASIWRVFSEYNFTATHVPLHQGSVKGHFNVHGHVHSVDVKDEDGNFDPRYINICVEKTGYKPLHLDEIIQIIKDRS